MKEENINNTELEEKEENSIDNEAIDNTEESDVKEQEDEKEITLSKKEYDDIIAKADKLDKLQDDFMRKIADFENAKKRLVKEKEDFAKFANEKIIAEFLPVIDNFDRALSHVDNIKGVENIIKGVELIKKQILDILTSNGLEKIEALGKEFDPHFHEAMGTVETDEYPVDTVAEEIQVGYLLKGKLLRPSWVRVAVAKNDDNDSGNDDNNDKNGDE